MTSGSGPGISGISLYVPRLRVDLQKWCDWTGNPWDKVKAVVGRSFRLPGPRESIYTLAANAVLRLIERHEVDPRRIGYFAFGTESSTDNAVGTVILKGMLDRALVELGRPPIARACEVPELKQACLAGVYGLKAASRYLATDGRGKQAIVVSADIAEYQRGSTGEQTQGAGAVAMLLESEARLCELDLGGCGSASAYRGLDFRKPFSRHFEPGYGSAGDRLHDFPVFNGKYSTACYVDEVVAALDDMFGKNGQPRRKYWEGIAALVMHRPYHHMPIQAMATALVSGMLASEEDRAALRGLCQEAGVDPAAVLRELEARPDLFALVERAGVDADPMPLSAPVIKKFRSGPYFQKFVAEKMSLGADKAMDLGNLYTASLPAWIAGAFEDAVERKIALAGRTVLAVGYGSGDAAEALPLKVVPGWENAAQKIGFATALDDGVDLDRAGYEALHDGRADAPEAKVRHGFVVDRVGTALTPPQQDVGIEYYRFVR